MAPTLEPYFTMRGYMSKDYSHNLNAIWSGPHRVIVPIVSGFLNGPNFEAEIVPGGGDWILRDPSTGVAHLDVRTMARTADGHSTYIHYSGVLKIDEKAGEVLSWSPSAKSTNFGDHHWFSGPIMETSDPKMKWIEDTLWVGEGRFVVHEKGSAVEYKIYKVSN
ncbi:Outer membrane protein, beta-barrel [Niveomyces insectorum RCEF 264]|uniref:Outer membrane protein, beta-barrel n=1 Tax=Niveomyces insectorum RCEF 264 TaxID=1081102 RepID=A0A168AC86_9HYPO|nr:Outer membrane protein, beta-barrel [Niveomyces insectorum RCEF 264]